jgi:hypothetical protein
LSFPGFSLLLSQSLASSSDANRLVPNVEEASDVVFIVVEGMPEGTGAPHSLHWKREIKKGVNALRKSRNNNKLKFRGHDRKDDNS